MSEEMKKCKAYEHIKKIWSIGFNKTKALIACELCPRCNPSQQEKEEVR